MKKAISIRLVLLAAIAVTVCGLLSSAIFALQSESQTKDWLTKLTVSASEIYQHDKDAKSISKWTGNLRVTVISPDGKVLSDSEADPNKMENHSDREEVKGAKENAVYIDIRDSDTVSEKFMYTSIRNFDGSVLRLAYHYDGLMPSIIAEIPAVIIAMTIALILSLFLASLFTKSVTAPLDNMVEALAADNYKKLENYTSSYYEIEKTLQAIRALLKKNAKYKAKVRSEGRKIKDFFSNASHELKTPITSILGFAELLNGDAIEDEEQKKQILQRIEIESKRMSELITDILLVSKLEAYIEPKHQGIFELNKTIDSVAAELLPIQGKINAQFELSDVQVYANERQLHELIANLLENAYKYTYETGKVKVKLKATGRNAILTITDTGIGISEKEQKRIFERFYRVDSEIKVSGTGLGLSIAKQIVTLYQGKIKLKSAIGKGTKIEVRLPIVYGAEF